MVEGQERVLFVGDDFQEALPKSDLSKDSLLHTCRRDLPDPLTCATKAPSRGTSGSNVKPLPEM